MPTDAMNWIDIADAVDDGHLDGGLDEIARAIQGRREVVARRRGRRAARELQPMDRVVLTNFIKPKYLEGLTGTILAMKESAAVVQIDELPSQKGRGRPRKDGGPTATGKLLVPFVHLEKVDADVQGLGDVDEEEYIGDDQDEDDDDVEDEDDDEDDDEPARPVIKKAKK